MHFTIKVGNVGNKGNDYRRFQYSRRTPVIFLVIGLYFSNKLTDKFRRFSQCHRLVFADDRFIDHEIFYYTISFLPLFRDFERDWEDVYELQKLVLLMNGYH